MKTKMIVRRMPRRQSNKKQWITAQVKLWNSLVKKTAKATTRRKVTWQTTSHKQSAATIQVSWVQSQPRKTPAFWPKIWTRRSLRHLLCVLTTFVRCAVRIRTWLKTMTQLLVISLTKFWPWWFLIWRSLSGIVIRRATVPRLSSQASETWCSSWSRKR